MRWLLQWAEMLEKEFAGALAINSDLEAAKKTTADSLLKSTSMVQIPPSPVSLYPPLSTIVNRAFPVAATHV